MRLSRLKFLSGVTPHSEGEHSAADLRFETVKLPEAVHVKADERAPGQLVRNRELNIAHGQREGCKRSLIKKKNVGCRPGDAPWPIAPNDLALIVDSGEDRVGSAGIIHRGSAGGIGP